MFTIHSDISDPVARLILKGNLTTDIIEQISLEINRISTGDRLYLLTDVSQADYQFSTPDIEKLIQITNQYINKKTIIYEAILIDTPKKTALTTIFKNGMNRPNHFSEIFYTEDAALHWLLSKIQN